MPTREQVQRLAARGLRYCEIGRVFSISEGKAYSIATGMPSDGGETYTDEERQRPGVLSTAQKLVCPSVSKPKPQRHVRRWVHWRVAVDPHMQAAVRRARRDHADGNS